MTASVGFRRLAMAPEDELTVLMRAGGGLETREVAGSVWRGWNRAAVFAVLGQRKFFKRVHEADGAGRVRGENVLAGSGRLDEPWRARLGGRGVFPFAVLEPGRGPDPGAPPDALVISYGALGRSRTNPIGWIVDHLVRPDDGRPDLLLGESILLPPVGGRRLIEHFVLERVEPGPAVARPAREPPPHRPR